MGDPRVAEVPSECGLRSRVTSDDAVWVRGFEEPTVIRASDVIRRQSSGRGRVGPEPVQTRPFTSLAPWAAVVVVLWVIAALTNTAPPCSVRDGAGADPPEDYFIPPVWADFAPASQDSVVGVVVQQLGERRRELLREKKARAGAVDPRNNGTVCPLTWLSTGANLTAGSPFKCPILADHQGAHVLDTPERALVRAPRRAACSVSVPAVASWLRWVSVGSCTSGLAWASSAVLVAALLTKSMEIMRPFSPFLLAGVAAAAGMAVSAATVSAMAWTVYSTAAAAVADVPENELLNSSWPGSFVSGPVASAVADAHNAPVYGCALCLRYAAAVGSLLLLSQLPQEGPDRGVMETWRNLLSLPVVVAVVAAVWRHALVRQALWGVLLVALAPLYDLCRRYSYMRRLPPSGVEKDRREGLTDFM
eukprot:TRINITY_DN33083_c0_g1_i1.p1 TRINITY_DN33083_c0_g1~~TRINITY_DN33083_c0_g1_i1.p1  ORF type:complete len:420 (+),score=128.59 TRINITY_DN33083_c0_g1_i1:42-1301(+)